MHFHGLGGLASSRSEWLGASRVRKTFPSGYGSPLRATPRENGSAEDFGGAATALNPRDEEKTGAAANDNVPLINGRWFKDALSMRGNCGPSLGLSETSPSGRVNLWSRSRWSRRAIASARDLATGTAVPACGAPASRFRVSRADRPGRGRPARIDRAQSAPDGQVRRKS